MEVSTADLNFLSSLLSHSQILPFPDPTPEEGLVDGVLPPRFDGGQSTVVSTSASYVHLLQKERDAGRRRIAGLEGVLKATGGEEMLDAWKAVSYTSLRV